MEKRSVRRLVLGQVGQPVLAARVDQRVAPGAVPAVQREQQPAVVPVLLLPPADVRDELVLVGVGEVIQVMVGPVPRVRSRAPIELHPAEIRSPVGMSRRRARKFVLVRYVKHSLPVFVVLHKAESPENAEPVVTTEPEVTAESTAESSVEPTVAAGTVKGCSRLRTVVGHALTVLAVLAIFVALIMPNAGSRILQAGTYVRLPIEGFLAIGLVLLLPGRWKRITAGILGAGLAVITIEKIADIGFRKTLARPFDLVLDWILLDDAQSFLKDSVGQAGAIGALSAWSWRRRPPRRDELGGGAAQPARRPAPPGDLAPPCPGRPWVACSWSACRCPAHPVASRSTAEYVPGPGARCEGRPEGQEGVREGRLTDAFRNTPADQLLTGLRGKDVIFTFIESYGRSAVEDPTMAPRVDAVLADGTSAERGRVLRQGAAGSPRRRAAAAAGWPTPPCCPGCGSTTSSATATSPRATSYPDRRVQAGRLADGRRHAGRHAGLAGGQFYGYDKVYDSRNLGYKGPALQLGDDARPVHADGVRTPRARQADTAR